MPLPGAEQPKLSKRLEYGRVYGAIETLCDSREPGGRLPNHPELMQELRASERTVLRALDELQRAGRIIRRTGAGTFVAVSPPTPEGSVGSALMDTRTLIAITKPDNSFFNRCLELLYRHAETAGLSLVCRLIDPETQPLTVPPLGVTGPLGFVVFRYDLAPVAQQILDRGHRVVLIGAPPKDVMAGVACIHGDHEQGAYLAAQHLIQLGHTHIAFAMINEGHRRSSRWQGHRQAIREAIRRGIGVADTNLPLDTVAEWEQDPARAGAYFRMPGAPTGLVVWNDHEAVRLLTVLTRAGISVPADVSLVGYDDLPEGSLAYPRLTTVDQGIGQQLRLALKLLTQPIPPAPTHTVLVTPTLVVRGSSAPPPDP